MVRDGVISDLISRFSGLLFNYFSLIEAESSSQYQFFMKTKKVDQKISKRMYLKSLGAADRFAKGGNN